MASIDVQQSSFPAASKSKSGLTNNLPTTVSTVSFTDRLLITISQCGKLSHWVHVPLATSASSDPVSSGSLFQAGSSDPETALLPRADLTATTVLGGTKREDEIVGQTLAATLASAILVKRPKERRLLVMGLGLNRVEAIGRSEYEEIIGLILDCL
ncbi:Hypothetical protein R9X50_00367900 [Acrodontium crateriforme]|uniref:Proteasome assembly chaperone 3 n=1 Tax=Acrodontium crateriforme TaxID=150365 RepID=A0AAQ3M3W0_9PEZI|nr:Hypothetical protein R9X50_00367900 [Acrodontium crateriforme]